MAETVSSEDLFGPAKAVSSEDLFSSSKAKKDDGGLGALFADDIKRNPIASQTVEQQQRGQALTESAAQGLFGIKPSNQSLQAKYPVQSFVTNAVSGVVPYLAPGGAMLKFAGIPAAHEIIRQATTPEESLTPTQKAMKVGTAGGFGALTGVLFKGSDLLGTIAQRVAAKGVSGGATSFADSLAQDAESGRDPDLKNAAVSFATNLSMIGLLGATVEIPALRGAIVNEASTIAGRPLNLEQSKTFLKSGKLFDDKGRLVSVTSPTENLEKLSPVMKQAMNEVKQKSAIKGVAEQAKDLGVAQGIVMDVYRTKNQATRLSLIDEQIYQKIKSATGRLPVFDWRTGLDYQFDYSKLNPTVAEQIKTLLDFRKQIAAGADPVDVLWKTQVAKQLNTKQVIQQALDEHTRNTKSMYAEQIKTAEAPQEKPLEFFNPGKVESVGETEAIRPYRPLNNSETMSYMPLLQMSLDKLKTDEEAKPVEQRRNIPDAVSLNHIQKDELLKEIKLKMSGSSNDEDIVNSISNKLSPSDENPKHEISVLSNQEGREDAPTKTRMWDWRNLREITPRDYARDLLQYNLQRKAAGLPEVNPAKDIIVHRSVYKGQPGGVAKQVRSLILDEYRLAQKSVTKLKEPPVDSSELFAQAPVAPVPIEEAAQTAGEQASVNLETPEAPAEIVTTEEMLPKAEEVHEIHRKHAAKSVRKAVMNLQSAEQLANMALHLEGTPEEKLRQLSQMSGLSTEQILIIARQPAKSDYPTIAEVDPLEKEDQLNDVLYKLQDWYKGIDTLPLDHIIEDTSGQSSFKIRDARQLPTYGSEESVAFPRSKKSNRRLGQSENIADMKKKLNEHKAYLGKMYLEEIHAAMETMNEGIANVVRGAIEGLKDDSDKARVLYASTIIKDAIREAQRAQVVSNRKKFDQAGQDLIEDDQVDKDYHEFEQVDPDDAEIPKEHEDFEGTDEPWTRGSDEGGFIRIPTKIKILKHTAEERDAPMFEVFRVIRNFPFLSDLRERFVLKYKREKETSDLRNFFKVSEEAHSLLLDTAKYLDAVKDLSYEDLKPIAEDVKLNIEEYLKKTGAKADKQLMVQRFDAIASLLLPHASEQVIVKAFDPNSFSYSKLGMGPHQTPQEAAAYVKHVKLAFNYFGIQQNDPMFQTDQQLMASRTPIFFQLLKHPNVMHNDSLERAVLFWKSQLEQVAYENQIKEGIFSNADVVKSYLEGFHKASYVMKGAQVGGESIQKNPLSGIEKPSKKYRSHAEFLERAATEGMQPVNDWFNDNFEYLVESMSAVKQAQLLKAVGDKRIPRMEYETKELQEINLKTPSPFDFHFIEHATKANIIGEAQRMSQLAGYEITPQKILQEGGWREGNQEWGLNKWYRGGFAAPYIYKPFAEEIRTIFRQHHRATDRLSKVARLSQALLTMSPLDNLTYLSGAILERPAWQVPFYITALPFRAAAAATKGVFHTGPKIAKGELSPSVPQNDHEWAWSRLFTENGSTQGNGLKSFFRHMIDSNDRSIFPWRQDKADRMGDYFKSALGSSQEVIGQMIAHDVLQAMIRIAENEVAKGRSVQEAARFTANYMNTASWNIHRSAYQGKFSDFMSNYVFISKNFLVNLVRIPMIIASATPAGKALKKAGAYNFKTEGGAGPFFSEIQNAIMGSDVPEEYREAMAWKLVGQLVGLGLASLLIKGLIQYMISLNHDDPTKVNLFENPEGQAGKVWLGIKDPLGKDIYADASIFKLTNNLASFWAPLYDPLANSLLKATHIAEDPNIKGSGPLEVIGGKMGFTPGLVEALFDRNLYDPNPDAWAQNVVRGLSKTFEGSIPSNPVVGSGELPYEYSSDEIVNRILMASTMSGVNLTRSYQQEFKEKQRTVSSEMFKKKEISSSIFTNAQALAAFREGKITSSQVKEQLRKQANPRAYFMRKNRSILRRAEQD